MKSSKPSERKFRLVSIFLLVAILSFSFSPILANKAQAQFGFIPQLTFETNPALVGHDITDMAKEIGGDTIIWVVVNAIIERIAASTINWINSGFQGSPAFITNPERYFTNLADGIAGQLIFSNPDLRFMCSGISARVTIALGNAYRQPYNFQCTLSQVVGNYDNFINNFDQGGWDAFIQITQNPQNNPIGLYNLRQTQLGISISAAQGQKKEELTQNKGFLSFRRCALYSDGTAIPDETGQVAVYDTGGQGDCIQEGPVETPGSVIQDGLSNVLNSGSNRLQVADEINEIITALFSQLVNKAIGGLAGLSRGDPGDNNEIFTSKLENATQNNTDIESIISSYPGFTPPPVNSGVPGGSNSGSSFVPITASDGSIITGPPVDTDCQLASFDEIIRRAGEIYYANPSLQTVGVTIANIVQVMNCGPGGTLPNSIQNTPSP